MVFDVVAEPSDEASLERITGEIDTTLFVEAGAGTGKTHALVERVVAILRSGSATIEQIVVITFTEKAASELRYRIRARLEGERAARVPDAGEDQGAGAVLVRLDDALASLDRAPVTTVHGFALRLVRELPGPAQVPLIVEVRDGVLGAIDRGEEYGGLVERMLLDSDVAPMLGVLRMCGAIGFGSGGSRGVPRLAELASHLESRRDLNERVAGTGSCQTLEACRSELKSALTAEITHLEEVGMWYQGGAIQPLDRLEERREGLVAFARSRLAGMDSIEDRDLLAWMHSACVSTRMQCFESSRVGQKASWADVESARVGVRDAQARLRTLAPRIAMTGVISRVSQEVLEAARLRERSGKLRYDDLLYLACRAMARCAPADEEALRSRYRYVLVDEFQDTDPLQLELVCSVLRVANPGDEPGLPERRGFMVGDPKQSIYRFRHADLATYGNAMSQARGWGGVVSLRGNRRSLPEILELVNAVFSSVLGSGGGEGGDSAYNELFPARAAPVAVPAAGGPGPPVLVVDQSDQQSGDGAGRSEQAADAEAGVISAAIGMALSAPWLVVDGISGEWRAARPDDIAVLVPKRSAIPPLERALGRDGIPYEVLASAGMRDDQIVNDLLAVMRAVAYPRDEAAVALALRTSLLGCGDDDLAAWRMCHHGRFDIGATVPDSAPVDDPVRESLTWLAGAEIQSRRLGIRDFLSWMISDRRVAACAALAGTRGTTEVSWRRIRWLEQCALRFEEGGGSSLRDLLQFLDGWLDDERASEAVLPETDMAAVRVMTVHAAKGLEFPVVALAGLWCRLPARKPSFVWSLSGKPEVALGTIGPKRDVLSTAGWEQAASADLAEDRAEARRVLYVAATRARDHLVVPLQGSRIVHAGLAGGDPDRSHPAGPPDGPAGPAAGSGGPAAGSGGPPDGPAGPAAGSAGPAGPAAGSHDTCVTYADVIAGALMHDSPGRRSAGELSRLGRSPVAGRRRVASGGEVARDAGRLSRDWPDGLEGWERERAALQVRAARRWFTSPSHLGQETGGYQPQPQPQPQPRWTLPALARDDDDLADDLDHELAGRRVWAPRDRGMDDVLDLPGAGAGGASSRREMTSAASGSVSPAAEFGLLVHELLRLVSLVDAIETGVGSGYDRGQHRAPDAMRPRWRDLLATEAARVAGTASLDDSDREAAIELVGRLVAEAGVMKELRAAISEEGRRHWREAYVSTMVEGMLLEGFVDLFYEDPSDRGALVVVDYKTMHRFDAVAISDHRSDHELQIAAYALALEASTGRRVSRAVLCYASPESLLEVSVANLPRAISAVHALLSQMGGA